MKPKMPLLSKKFMVPTSSVALGIGNQLLDAGLPPWLIITIIAASVAYAAIEAWVDVARMKYAVPDAPKPPTP